MKYLTWVCLVVGAGSAFAATRPVVVGLTQAIPAVNLYAPATIESYRVLSLIYEPLAKASPRDGRLTPWLATSWTSGATGLRVQLRPNVTSHDGRTLDAAMVVAQFNAFRDPLNKAATWLPLFEPITEARVRGPLEVEFLSANLRYESIVNLLTGLRVSPGTGPYRVRTVTSSRVELSPAGKWWHGPQLQSDLHFKNVDDHALARQMIAKGELDFAVGNADDDDGVATPGGTGLWLDLNLRRQLFADPKVRRALLLLWDRSSLNQKVYRGRQRVALDAFDPTSTYYPAGKPEAYDPKRARQLLHAAGWRPRDGRLMRGDHAFEFEVLVFDAPQERWVGLYQRSLREAGITMTIKRLIPDLGWQRLKDGAYDAAAGGGDLLWTVDRAAWASHAPYNTNGVASKAIDEQLATLDTLDDAAKRSRVHSKLIELARGELAMLPGLVTDHGVVLTSKRLKIDPAFPFEAWRWRLTD